ncbi:hypothetical protein PsYK624_085960 [Phanerochaete sordida]|uniref:Uncharacterized protein n=1 Tax=Phanerochaete sordida TaxID=48140 RepID=A0A9P3LFW0_9APHY|nr:hypothetical protein PsYK624_085960 [Phanerochaete sordida]
MGSGLSVCSDGQIGIATTFAGYSTTSFYGVLLDHKASEISSSNAIAGNFDNPAQAAPCVGTYDNGASVQCSSDGTVISATDTQGNKWNCNKNTSPIEGAAATFTMYACCSRA